jgi:hypothetical protein
MNIQEALQRLGPPPVGFSSMIAAPNSVSGEGAEKTPQITIAQVNEKLEQLGTSLRACKSDAEYWGYAAQESYWKAVHSMLEAAEITGPEDIPDLPAPKLNGVLMDMMGQQEAYGRRILECAHELRVARQATDRPVMPKVIDVTESDLKAIAEPVIEHMNKMVRAGTHQHVVIGSILYALGGAMFDAGIVLHPEMKLDPCMAPMLAAYGRAARAQMERKDE